MRWDQGRAESQPSSTPSLSRASLISQAAQGWHGWVEVRSEGPPSSLRDPPVAGPRRRSFLGRPSTTSKGRGINPSGTQRPRPSRHPPSAIRPRRRVLCTVCGQPIRAPRLLTLSLLPRCCRGRSQASLCCDISQQQPISRPVRPIRLTCCGPMATTRVLVLRPKFSSISVRSAAVPSTHCL
jgi:hypothetical protein